jgi:hypothetical protein
VMLLVAADVDSDGDIDLAVINNPKARIDFLLQRGKGESIGDDAATRLSGRSVNELLDEVHFRRGSFPTEQKVSSLAFADPERRRQERPRLRRRLGQGDGGLPREEGPARQGELRRPGPLRPRRAEQRAGGGALRRPRRRRPHRPARAREEEDLRLPAGGGRQARRGRGAPERDQLARRLRARRPRRRQAARPGLREVGGRRAAALPHEPRRRRARARAPLPLHRDPQLRAHRSRPRRPRRRGRRPPPQRPPRAARVRGRGDAGEEGRAAPLRAAHRRLRRAEGREGRATSCSPTSTATAAPSC